MEKRILLWILLVATILMKTVLATPSAPLTCEAFSEQKLEDCNYILASDLSNE